MASPPSRLLDHRRALLPAAQTAEPAACYAALTEGGATFLGFVLAQDLGPLWHHSLQSGGLVESLPSDSIDALRQARISAAVSYLAQRSALDRIDRLFDTEGIAYVVMKGAHVRERAYPDPSIRPSCDIDILVAAIDRQRAARTLLDAGYRVHAAPATISHEATFCHGIVDIDLHWDILRPGCTRVDMTAGFLARRQRTNGFWGLSDVDTLFLMLTHPAFAKYVCSPNMGLGRVADFLFWIQHRSVEWSAVWQLLDSAGLKTAAWTMLSWFRMLAAPEAAAIIDGWQNTVAPSRPRAAYLRYWLAHDLPTRWLNRPLPIQIGFTLFLHDRLTDALHAFNGWWQARRNTLTDARLLLGMEYTFDRHAR